jgi:hypothetical protein
MPRCASLVGAIGRGSPTETASPWRLQGPCVLESIPGQKLASPDFLPKSPLIDSNWSTSIRQGGLARQCLLYLE